MKAWSAANSVSKDQLKYWLRALKGRPSSAACAPTARFVPLSVRELTTELQAPMLFVHVGLGRIALQAGFDAKLLREAVAALSASC